MFVGTGAPQDYQGERKADGMLLIAITIQSFLLVLAIISYAQSLLPSLKSFKTAKALDEFLGASSSVPKYERKFKLLLVLTILFQRRALVFSDKSTSVPLKSVAFHFKSTFDFLDSLFNVLFATDRLAFGEIPSSKDKSLATRFGVTTFPSVVCKFPHRLSFALTIISVSRTICLSFKCSSLYAKKVIVPAGSKAAESELPRSADFSHQGLFSFASVRY